MNYVLPEPLVKYPVYTEKGTYKVVIEEDVFSGTLFGLEAKVYVERTDKRWFKSNFKKVWEEETSIAQGYKYSKRLKSFAIHAVNEYERSKRTNERFEESVQSSIKDLELWDGDMRGGK